MDQNNVRHSSGGVPPNHQPSGGCDVLELTLTHWVWWAVFIVYLFLFPYHLPLVWFYFCFRSAGKGEDKEYPTIGARLIRLEDKVGTLLALHLCVFCLWDKLIRLPLVLVSRGVCVRARVACLRVCVIKCMHVVESFDMFWLIPLSSTAV